MCSVPCSKAALWPLLKSLISCVRVFIPAVLSEQQQMFVLGCCEAVPKGLVTQDG